MSARVRRPAPDEAVPAEGITPFAPPLGPAAPRADCGGGGQRPGPILLPCQPLELRLSWIVRARCAEPRGRGERPSSPSGHNRDCAELAEMVIECHDGADAEAFDHHAADAIREAPPFIAKGGEHPPGGMN